MSETRPDPNPKPQSGLVQWDQFLAEHAPDKERKVSGMGRATVDGPEFSVNAPDLRLHCDSADCDGPRIFGCRTEKRYYPYQTWCKCFLQYVCKNCSTSEKLYALRFRWDMPDEPKDHGFPGKLVQVGPDDVTAVKLGEWPPLGPIVPKKLLKLMGNDKDLFKQGSRAEGHGLGLGAFAYYRQAVENQRTRIFDQLIEAAKRLSVAPTTISDLESDRNNWRFSDSVSKLKAALPDALKINGESPLAILHNALSYDIHNETDDACLDRATDIRTVLAHFSGQLDQILKNRDELEKALGRLTSRPKPWTPPEAT